MATNLLTVKTAEKLVKGGISGMTSDGLGLYLKVTKPGNGSWIFRFKINGKSRDMGIGSYESITLAHARMKAADARKLARSGVDPLSAREIAQSAAQIAEKENRAKDQIFEQLAADYIDSHRKGWKSAKHAQQWENTLKTYAYPTIGKKVVQDITTDDVLKVLMPIWNTKPETASRVRNRIELVLDAAKARSFRSGENPALWRGHLDKLLPKRKAIDRGNHPALPWPQLPKFMQTIATHSDLSAQAVQLTILTALRTNEVLGATWAEVDLESGIWIIPATRMKAPRPHRVPLSQPAIDLIKSLPDHDASSYLFPGAKAGRPLSNMAMLQKIRGMDEHSIKNGNNGWRSEDGEIITMHGFRSTFRDWAAESTNFANIIPEMALAHKINSATEAAYRRGDLLEKRRELMEAWANYANSAPTTTTMGQAATPQTDEQLVDADTGDSGDTGDKPRQPWL